MSHIFTTRVRRIFTLTHLYWSASCIDACEILSYQLVHFF